MATTQSVPATQMTAESAQSAAPESWRLPTRIAFSFFFIYFSLYVLLTQMLGSLLPFLDTDDFWGLGTAHPIQAFVFFVGKHVFHVSHTMVVTGSGSGDKTFDWILNFCILVLAVLGAALWSVFDRQRKNYITLHAWFRLFIRFSLGATMITYGMMKVLPIQMPFPYLTRLLEPFGHFSPMGVLWTFVGASKAYEISVGCAELAGGILLFHPRTSLFGALICFTDALQVFLLNMTYDVPVKLFSFNLILFSLFLLAPDARRLLNVLFLNRPAAPACETPLFQGRRMRRMALAAQVLFGACLLSSNLHFAIRDYRTSGPASPKSPLYGIWTVEDFVMDGRPHLPLLTDNERWRRLVFEFPQYAAVEGMDGTMFRFGARIAMSARNIEFSKQTDKNWKAVFSFQQPVPTQLLLDGSFDKHNIRARLELFDPSKLPLLSREFHWVQEYPFNR